MTKKQALRLGFIGGSNNSAVGYAHAVASQLDGRWKLVSGCFSSDKASSEETAETWDISAEKAYADWKLYIEEQSQSLDAVAVLTPTPTHCEIVCALLDAGVAVICEKAMAATLEQSQKIREALDRTEGKGFLAITFNYTGYPMLRVLRKHIRNGDLGKLKQIQIEMPTDGFIQAKEKMSPQAWRLKDGEIPTLLLDLAVHLHNIVDFTTGLKALSVNADFHHFSIFDGIIDDAYIWAKYEQDLRVSYWVSKTALGKRNGMHVRIYGEEGSAEWHQEEPELLHLYAKDSARATYDRANCKYQGEIVERFKAGHPAGFVEAFANLYTDISDALLCHHAGVDQKNEYVSCWEQASAGLHLLNAATQSNRERRWINITWP